MSRKVVIIDTSVLCCWLKVPGKETAGPDHDRWNYERVEILLAKEKGNGSTFILPLASIIETGNHIAQSSARRYECAQSLAKHLHDVADGTTPWAAFTEQSTLWEPQNLKALADTWPPLAASNISLGDATIKDVAEQYARGGFEVEILTGDKGLKSYEPLQPAAIPRRRQ